MAKTAAALQRAKQLLHIILVEDAERLEKIDRYANTTHHDDPYMPENASHEYKLLARRCVSNWFPLLVSTPAQACYVDDFRPTREGESASFDPAAITPEWRHWQRSRMDSRQSAIYRGALTFGHAFVLTELVDGKAVSKGLSAMRTAALFRDPANDDVPQWVLTLLSDPDGDTPGRARLWDGATQWEVSYKDESRVTLSGAKAHGASSCPVTRFVAQVDLEGRTVGVVEPMIYLQDRINQTIFDLLVAQTFASIKVRTVSGMAPPMQMRTVETVDEATGQTVTTQVPVLDRQGRPVPEPVRSLGARLLYAKDPNTKFDTLDETPLGGFIEAVDMSVRHLSAQSQTPPHYLLGQIANLSADALKAAEISLSRKIAEYRMSFGESWERVFRIGAELEGLERSAADNEGEVIWRDMELSSLAQAADGLGKLADQLQVPPRSLWGRIPNITAGEKREMLKAYDQDQIDRRLAESLERAQPGASVTRSASAAQAASRAATAGGGSAPRVAA